MSPGQHPQVRRRSEPRDRLRRVHRCWSRNAACHGPRQDAGNDLVTERRRGQPYLPQQLGYDGTRSTQIHNKFAEVTGFGNSSSDVTNQTVFEYPKNTNSVAVQMRGALVNMEVDYGQWASLPVADGDFLLERSSVQLLKGKIDGKGCFQG